MFSSLRTQFKLSRAIKYLNLRLSELRFESLVSGKPMEIEQTKAVSQAKEILALLTWRV